MESRCNYEINNTYRGLRGCKVEIEAEAIIAKCINKCRVDNADASRVISLGTLISRRDFNKISRRDDSSDNQSWVEHGRLFSPGFLFARRSVYREFSYFRFFFRAIRADCEKNPLRFPSSKLASLLDGAHCIGIGTRSPLKLCEPTNRSPISPAPTIVLSVRLTNCFSHWIVNSLVIARRAEPGTWLGFNTRFPRRIASWTSAFTKNFIPDICRAISFHTRITRRWQFDFDRSEKLNANSYATDSLSLKLFLIDKIKKATFTDIQIFHFELVHAKIIIYFDKMEKLE